MRKENDRDPKTWKFELSINKQNNKKIETAFLISLLLLFITLIVGLLYLVKSMGSVEVAIRIICKKTFISLLCVLFVCWIISKKIRKKYWPIIVVPVLALVIIIFVVNNYPGEIGRAHV